MPDVISPDGATPVSGALIHIFSRHFRSRKLAEKIKLVFAGPKETAAPLRRIVEEAGWRLYHNPDWRWALNSAVRSGATVFLFDCDANPSEWEEALGQVVNAANGAAFIMTSRLADDRLWAELLARGGYDLILKPFNSAEVLRTIRSAHARHGVASTPKKETPSAVPNFAIARAS